MSPVPADARPKLADWAVLRRDQVRAEDQLLMPERVVRLNVSSAAILRCCDGSQTVSEIVHVLEDQFGVQGLTGDVEGLVVDLGSKGWLQW